MCVELLLLCWYTCNQRYTCITNSVLAYTYLLYIHPSATNSKTFKNQVNTKYMQSVFPLLPFHITKMSRSI